MLDSSYLKLGNASAGAVVLISILYILVGIASSVIGYVVYCMPQERMAKKLNAGAGWMAYIPVARNIQRMKMAAMPMWKLLFVGKLATWVIAGAVIALITWIFSAISPAFAIVVCCILTLAYLVFYFMTTYQYNAIILEKFEYDTLFSFILTFVFGLDVIFSYIFAFSNRLSGTPGSAPVSGPKPGPAPGPVPAPSAGPAGIEGVFGMYAGAQFELKGADVFTIGRDGTLSNIIISSNGEKVSKRHCSVRFIAQEGVYEVTDFSSNGTFYGNSRLVRDIPTKLPKGTILILGDKTNQFKLM